MQVFFLRLRPIKDHPVTQLTRTNVGNIVIVIHVELFHNLWTSNMTNLIVKPIGFHLLGHGSENVILSVPDFDNHNLLIMTYKC